jgi:antitoxin Phd
MKATRRNSRQTVPHSPREHGRPRSGQHKQVVQGPSFTATEAKNQFGEILERAMQGEAVVITRHDAPKAVLISVDQFHALQHAPELKLQTLSREFDALLLGMQNPKVRNAMDVAFHASPQQLGRAAVRAARKRA